MRNRQVLNIGRPVSRISRGNSDWSRSVRVGRLPVVWPQLYASNRGYCQYLLTISYTLWKRGTICCEAWSQALPSGLPWLTSSSLMLLPQPAFGWVCELKYLMAIEIRGRAPHVENWRQETSGTSLKAARKRRRSSNSIHAVGRQSVPRLVLGAGAISTLARLKPRMA